MSETVEGHNRALTLYERDEPLTPDAILSGPVRLTSEYDPEDARRRAGEQMMAWENMSYHAALAFGAFVEAMQPVMAAVREAFSAFASTPEMRRLARDLGLSVDDEPRRPTRHDRHMARVAATPRRRKRDRRRY